ISITETIEPTQYVLRVEGANGQGFLHGEGTFNLNQEGEENELRTIVTYKGVANVGGTLAGIGARMLQPVAKLLVGNFFKSMEKQLNGQEGDSTEIEKSIAI
ncbi:MAG: SRPBCC domain-containing protein, partial [Chloroflexota bacterium]